MDENLEQRTRRSFLKRSLLAGGTALLSLFIACSTPDGPEPPPPPTKYKHSIKVEAGKTLHYGQPVTGGTFRVTMEGTGTVYPPISQDAANLGTTLNLAETTTREEPCTIILYPKVNFDNDCLTREYRTIGVTNNTLRAENVIKLEDVDWTYLHTEVLTKKDNMGRSLNTSWEPRILNASSNPDPLTGLRLETRYIEGQLYTIDGVTKLYGIKPALLDFQEWGKKYVGTAFEEAYITNVINFVNANYLPSETPTDGDFRAFSKSDTSGVTSVTFPTTEVKVMSSIERANPSSASPWTAHWEALGAVIAGNTNIGDPDRYKTCIPVLEWRLKGDGDVYWIDGVVKESQKGVDNLGTTLLSFAQEFEYLPAAASYYGNTTIGNKVQIDYAPGVAHWTSGLPFRESAENSSARDRNKRKILEDNSML